MLKMLSPEYVDVEKNLSNYIVKIGFVDDNVEPCFELLLTENDAFKLGTMLIEQTNMKAKEKRNR